jgi:hypothetical protein
MASQITSLFQDFGRQIGIERLALDDYGYCCLFFDDVCVNIEVEETSGRLFLYARIGDLPPQCDRIALYELLLDGNHFFQGTDGGTLGVDTDNGIAAFVQSLSLASLDVRGLELALERFVALTRNWQDRWQKVVETASNAREAIPGFSEGIRG